jgi:glycosyltransferase involved in cell wall biosynthesis
MESKLSSTPVQSKLSSLSIFFPFYNEEENIVNTVETAIAAAKEVSEKYEIIAVDDGSKDKTGELADTLVKKYPGIVKAFHHNPNQGYGGALKTGFKNSSYDWVFFSDGDGQFDLMELKGFLPFVKDYDAIIGYRIKRADPFIRLVNAKLWGVFIKVLFGLKVKDIDCAFKLIKKDVLNSFEFKSDGATVSSELLVMAQRNKFKIKQIGVHHYPREAGKQTGANPKVIIKAFVNAVKLKKLIK